MIRRFFPIVFFVVLAWLLPIVESAVLAPFGIVSVPFFAFFLVITLLVLPRRAAGLSVLGGAVWRDVWLFLPVGTTLLPAVVAAGCFLFLESRLSHRTFWTDTFSVAGTVTSFVLVTWLADLGTRWVIELSYSQNQSLGRALTYAVVGGLLVAFFTHRASRHRQYIT